MASLGLSKQLDKLHIAALVLTSTLRCTVRRVSSKVREERLSKYLVLKKVANKSRDDKPLVLLFDWLYAKPSALTKYCNLYHEQGMDVLLIKGRLRHFLWPPYGFKLADSVLEYTTEELVDSKRLIIHAFSIGAYNYTLTMIRASNEARFNQFRRKVIGQVFDSAVIGTYDNMSTGIAASFTKNKIIQHATLLTMNTYYNLTRKHTRDKYDEFMHCLIHNPIVVPTLIFYALNDPMCDSAAMQALISTWERNFPKLVADVKCWERSVHAAHLKLHEYEYRKVWDKFIQNILANYNV